ncbi:hypothetical protein IFM58399_05780 [Aspergillus lentulus]|uniref:O-methyltransferase domain-containing protein n=1 Tax=Aspergillus lentulus TaxID=293939 RepID=A0AAN5YRU5_ASPLE|nr:uncharacterized protein IFM58399_05780 [Aspergillus lentulus]KAF4155510.1 hypothetical protein CNMCM6069_007918 [Aspergillus lentulus]KAF4167405.1 hypothetical protein CNMCM6936_005362 [Aspergillus lentulus]KAF4179007.1 hypothetical protein CNMCM8060_003767 [Aspergillus lentulus]KAF4188556.1 hypothetical protein CNMCM7927_001251 [Aspergillus lentulus]KAF4193632.1 hypothetical protein CNMCM8694_008604 [Aspergillus lentulus]
MDDLAQLQSCSNELATAITSLASYAGGGNTQQAINNQSPFEPEEVQRAKGNILAVATKLRALICGPTDFLQHLASQSEILACLRWLGEFQILACIPLVGSAPIKDIADLTNVPESRLRRIIRLTATAGFLREPERDHVAHTPLSASFFSNPSLLDAAMFLSESAAPTALQMPQTAQVKEKSSSPPSNGTPCDLALPRGTEFHTARKRRPKLNRQWLAYLHHAAGLHTADDIAAVLTQLDWPKLTNGRDGSIIEVGVSSWSTSIARRLAHFYPALHFTVQISDPAAAITQEEFHPRITATSRILGTRQTAAGAAVYILHLPFASSSPSAVMTELAVHLDVLRSRSGILLILTPRLLPQPGSLPDAEVEATARSRDLALWQMADEGEMEMLELLETIDTVRDSLGKLVVTSKLRSRNNLVVAVTVEYQRDLPS